MTTVDLDTTNYEYSLDCPACSSRPIHIIEPRFLLLVWSRPSMMHGISRTDRQNRVRNAQSAIRRNTLLLDPNARRNWQRHQHSLPPATAVGDSTRQDSYSILGATPARQRRAAETSTIRADLRRGTPASGR